MDADNRLLFWGTALFFLSLLTGLLLVAGPSFVANPRGVLAGHLEAAMNGMFVMLVALFIRRVRLSPRELGICRGTLLYSAFANWFFTTLAGIVGASEATPLAGAGYQAAPALEQIVLIGLVTVALTAVVSVGLLLRGLWRGTSAAGAAPAA